SRSHSATPSVPSPAISTANPSLRRRAATAAAIGASSSMIAMVRAETGAVTTPRRIRKRVAGIAAAVWRNRADRHAGANGPPKGVVRRDGRPMSIVRIDGLDIDRDSRRVRVEGHDVAVTPTEFAVLSLLAGNPGAVFTRRDILESVSGGP